MSESERASAEEGRLSTNLASGVKHVFVDDHDAVLLEERAVEPELEHLFFPARRGRKNTM